jgi:hypothetical protein
MNRTLRENAGALGSGDTGRLPLVVQGTHPRSGRQLRHAVMEGGSRSDVRRPRSGADPGMPRSPDPGLQRRRLPGPADPLVAGAGHHGRLIARGRRPSRMTERCRTMPGSVTTCRRPSQMKPTVAATPRLAQPAYRTAWVAVVAIGRSGMRCHGDDPVGLPTLPVVVGEGLLKARRPSGDVLPDVPDLDPVAANYVLAGLWLPAWTKLGVWDGLVGEVGEVVTDRLGVDEAHGLLVAGLAEEALAGPEHDREDLQPQLVDQVVLQQRA